MQDRITNFLEIAEAVSKRSECMKESCGAVIVKGEIIASTGCSIIPRGCLSCESLGFCSADKCGLCRCIHAEIAAILNADPHFTKGAVMYVVRRVNGECDNGYVPDRECRKLILNAGITSVIIRAGSGYVAVNTESWINQLE